MRRTPLMLLLAALMLALWLGTAVARRVACDKVISRVDHEVVVEHGRAVDISEVAKALGTSPTWVERCMEANGRRPKRPGLESAESREERLENLEEEEPEEEAPEDNEEPGARERREHPAKERQLHIRPTPTPGIGKEY